MTAQCNVSQEHPSECAAHRSWRLPSTKGLPHSLTLQLGAEQKTTASFVQPRKNSHWLAGLWTVSMSVTPAPIPAAVAASRVAERNAVSLVCSLATTLEYTGVRGHSIDPGVCPDAKQREQNSLRIGCSLKSHGPWYSSTGNLSACPCTRCNTAGTSTNGWCVGSVQPINGTQYSTIAFSELATSCAVIWHLGKWWWTCSQTGQFSNFFS